jgi:hypothetical protein
MPPDPGRLVTANMRNQLMVGVDQLPDVLLSVAYFRVVLILLKNSVFRRQILVSDLEVSVSLYCFSPSSVLDDGLW